MEGLLKMLASGSSGIVMSDKNVASAMVGMMKKKSKPNLPSEFFRVKGGADGPGLVRYDAIEVVHQDETLINVFMKSGRVYIYKIVSSGPTSSQMKLQNVCKTSDWTPAKRERETIKVSDGEKSDAESPKKRQRV